MGSSDNHCAKKRVATHRCEGHVIIHIILGICGQLQHLRPNNSKLLQDGAFEPPPYGPATGRVEIDAIRRTLGLRLGVDGGTRAGLDWPSCSMRTAYDLPRIHSISKCRRLHRKALERRTELRSASIDSGRRSLRRRRQSGRASDCRQGQALCQCYPRRLARRPLGQPARRAHPIRIHTGAPVGRKVHKHLRAPLEGELAPTQ
mmetsp:Transcript_23781/g.72753  ORF Transcript_23781/g.72753 Transcript_23781/m.72753 type:complete len:203 (-) Transcript_23781:2126-2734(-)|eukprot:scaffold133658_cov30-Tisochrysis_lutea.AAC.5